MLAIRLKRMGSTHRPYYRIVVSESDRTPTARCVEELGYYHPISSDKATVINEERAKYWLARGAQPSPTVKSLLKKKSIV
jgi:small subunit ribosomal protein S16